MNNHERTTPNGVSTALGQGFALSHIHEFASRLNVSYDAKEAVKDPNLALSLLASSGIEQFLASEGRDALSEHSINQIVRAVQSYSPQSTEEKIKRQAVGSNDIFRIAVALTTASKPVLQCSEADVVMCKSEESDKRSDAAMETSKYLGRSVYDQAKREYEKSLESDGGLSGLGIVLSSISTICHSSKSLGVSSDVLLIALLEMVHEIANKELRET